MKPRSHGGHGGKRRGDLATKGTKDTKEAVLFRVTKLAAIALATITVVLVVSSLVIAEFVHEIDLNAGRQRNSVAVFGRSFFQSVDDTEFSRRFHIDAGDAAQWVRVSSARFWNSVSPHYRFHNAEHLLEVYLLAHDMLQTPVNEQRVDAQRLLEMIRTGRKPDAERFVHQQIAVAQEQTAPRANR